MAEPIGKEPLTPEQEMELRSRIARGREFQAFLNSKLFKNDIGPFIEGQKADAIQKAYASMDSHAALATCIAYHLAFDTMLKGLHEIAAEANLSIDDLPEDESPVVQP
jgi:hypothetical protein